MVKSIIGFVAALAGGVLLVKLIVELFVPTALVLGAALM